MEYKDFCSELKRGVLQNTSWNIKEEHYQFYADGFTSKDPDQLEMIRNTNLKYHHKESDSLIGDYVILYADIKEAFCRFSTLQLFEEYKKSGWDRVWSIVDDAIQTIHNTNIEEVLAKLENHEVAKEKLIIRPINYTDNRYELKKMIYKQYDDVALVLYTVMYDNKEMGLGTLKVQKHIFEKWGKDLEEVWEDALINSNIIAPPRMYMTPMECYQPSYTKGAFMAINSDITHIGKMQVPTITTTKQTNGAIAMFYPGVLERISELIGDSFYVVFTSIHEARVHHIDAISPRTILQSLKNVNKAFAQDEILSRKVFLYDKEKKSLAALEL